MDLEESKLYRKTTYTGTSCYQAGQRLQLREDLGEGVVSLFDETVPSGRLYNISVVIDVREKNDDE